MMDRKILLWGGAGVVALVAGAWIYSSVGSGAAPASTGVDPATLGALQPVTYSSGTGTVPIDSGSVDTGGSSSLSALTALLPFQQQQEADNVALQSRNLDIQQMLGLANINANTAINTTNANAGITSSLAALAAAINQSVVGAKSTAAVTGQINGNGLNLTYTAEQLTGKSKWNTTLQSPNGGGITLANGQLVKG